MTRKFFDYLQLIRAPAVFTAQSNILAAHLVATQGQFQWLNLFLLLISSSLLYMSGMVLNDCFDYDEDCQDRPQRPLPSGRIAIKTAWQFSGILMISGIAIAALVGYQQWLLAMFLAFLILLYNSYAKHTVFGFLAMGLCRYLNWLLGLSVITFQWDSLILALPVLFYVCSLTLLSTIETTAHSRLPLIICSIGMIVTAIMLITVQQTESISPALLLTIVIISLLFILKALLKTYQNFNPEQIQKTMVILIMGIIPLDALLVLSKAPWWGSFMILLLLIPSKILGKYMRVT